QRQQTPAAFWPRLRVRVVAGRAQRVRVQLGNDQLKLYLPPLRGDEFISLTREQHGGDVDVVQHGGLSSERVALRVQAALFGMLTGRRRAWHGTVLLDTVKTLRGLPLLVPLRVIRPTPPRDRLKECHEKVVAQEKVWTRKAKLAATKLKKLRSKRLRYEKRLATRREA
ncbi:MAG: hypothetical protein ACRD3C_20880, partial [Vicinamibacterales bacterium]